MTTSTDKPPLVVMQEGLDALHATTQAQAATLATLVRQHEKDKDLGLLVADCRETVTEVVGIMHSQLSDVLMRLDGIEQRLAPVPPPPRRCSWPVGLSGALAGIALLGAVWWCWPPSRYEAFAGALDGVMAQHYSALPKPVQEAVTAVYGRFHFQAPSARAKGGK
jgi:hypothetical protein